MGAVVRLGSQFADRLYVAAQFVCDHNPRLAKLGDQPLEEPLCGICVSACLHENVEHVSIRVNRAPQPMFPAADQDHDVIEMPLVIRPWAILANAICEMLPKTINPQPDRFPADNHAPICQQVFNICRAQCEAVVRPDCVSNNLAGIANALKAWHIGRNDHTEMIARARPLNNLAIPSADLPALWASPTGPVLMLLAALSWSIGNILMQACPWTLSPLARAVWFFVISAGLTWPLVVIIEPLAQFTIPSPAILWIFAFHVCGPMVACYVMWTILLGRLSATVAAISTLIAPVVGVLSSVSLLNEDLT